MAASARRSVLRARCQSASGSGRSSRSGRTSALSPRKTPLPARSASDGRSRSDQRTASARAASTDTGEMNSASSIVLPAAKSG